MADSEHIKRVLWIDDYAGNDFSRLFNETKTETKVLKSLSDAITEFSGPRLYDYDTIILDINFENDANLIDNDEYLKEVTDKLKEKIYLKRGQENDCQYIIHNCGYLLYLYLLERGYPSENIAFLTGTGQEYIIDSYNNLNKDNISNETVYSDYYNIWNSLDNKGDFYAFEEKIDKLPIDQGFRYNNVIITCFEAFSEKDYEKARDTILNITPTGVQNNAIIVNNENNETEILTRFHEANIQIPSCFPKLESIGNLSDSKIMKWISKRRTPTNLTRWYILYISDLIEGLFNTNDSFSNNINKLFYNEDSNENSNENNNKTSANNAASIRTAFSQTFSVFDGLKSRSQDDFCQSGPYYQAVSALLIPFDAKPNRQFPRYNKKYSRNPFQINNIMTWCAKIARNCCAHDKFSSQLSNESAIFLIAVVVTSILPQKKRQKNNVKQWYEEIYKYYNRYNNLIGLNIPSIEEPVKYTTANLLYNKEIDVRIDPKTKKPIKDYDTNAVTLMYTLSNTKENKSESYYIFAIAAGILKWFEFRTAEEVKGIFDKPVQIVYEIAAHLAKTYLDNVKVPENLMVFDKSNFDRV